MKMEEQCFFLLDHRAEVGNFDAAKDLDQPVKIYVIFQDDTWKI